MQNPRRNRLAFRPFRWVFLLLISCCLWIVFLRVLLIIPTPGDVDNEHSYFSPLPARAFMYFFHLNAPLLGWHPRFPGDQYTTSFGTGEDFNLAKGGCASSPVMFLKIAPGLLWGTYIHWEVVQITICGHTDDW